MLELELYPEYFNQPDNGNVKLVIANLQLPKRLGESIPAEFPNGGFHR